MGAVWIVPADLLVATHLLAAFTGGLLVYVAVVHYGVRVMMHPPHLPHLPRVSEDDDVPHTRTLRRGTWLAIVVLIASAMVVTTGVAAYLQQRQVERQTQERAEEVRLYGECLSQWGADLASMANARNAERKTYDRAQEAYDRADAARAEATADVLRIVLELRSKPPRADETSLDAALARATAADERADRARERVEAATMGLDDAPPYKPPTLTCGRTP